MYTTANYMTAELTPRQTLHSLNLDIHDDNIVQSI